MIYLIIAALLIAVIILTIKLILLKKEIKKVTARLSKDDKRALPVDGVDRDLSDMIVEINKMYDRTLEIRNNASKSEKSLRSAISIISHDMKTPLTSVIGYLQLAQKSEGDETRKNIEIALERAAYLNELVNDFFDVSLAESDKFVIDPESLNVCELVCEEIFALAPSFDKCGIVPRFGNADEDIRIITDRKMLTRIIQNLLSNCIKYSEKKTDISLRKEADKVHLTITSGSSKPVDTEKIFDKFYREDESRSGSGAGLGMYICKKFTIALGGEISAEQEDGELCIHLLIPDRNSQMHK